MQKLLSPLAVLIYLVLSGCVGFTHIHSSNPSIEGDYTFKRQSDGLFYAKDIAFVVVPWNENYSDTMIFPVPLHKPTYQTTFTNTFSATIVIKTELKNAFIDITEIKYTDSSADSHSPIYIRGSFDCAKEVADNPVNIERTKVSKRVALINNVTNCIFVEFNTKTPQPKENFKISLYELRNDSKSIKLPTIIYSEKEYNRSAVVP